MTDRSDKSEGPTAGTETADPLECLARVLTHIPDTGQVTTRYYAGGAPLGRAGCGAGRSPPRRCARADRDHAAAGPNPRLVARDNPRLRSEVIRDIVLLERFTPDDRCIVTTEGSRPTRQRANRHLPDVCTGFAVRVCNTFELTRRLNFLRKTLLAPSRAGNN